MNSNQKSRNNRHAVAGTILSLLLVGLSGCKDNPGKWPPEKVAEKVSSSLNVTGLALTATDQGLEGTGKNPDGETFSVVVTLHPESNEIRWKAEGDRGSIEEGYYALQ